MKTLVRYLMFFALCATLANSQQDTSEATSSPAVDDTTETGRGLATNSYNTEEKLALKKNSHIYMGIYKNYKSTYLGNKTTSEYKKRLRDRINGASKQADRPEITGIDDYQEFEQEQQVEQEQQQQQAVDDVLVQELRSEAEAEALLEAQTDTPIYDENETGAGKKRRKRKRKNRNSNKRVGEPALVVEDEPGSNNVELYQVGPGLNVSLDMSNDIVRVKLDGENLREIVGGRWLITDNSEEGRGKKYDMITKVLPLFILPFLIQSAIVPFLVTKLKLLLVKSILVGKLAIFLLILSAIKNSNKMMQSYEVAPSYWAGEPSRRSELAAAASSAAAAYNGYRVEGKPTTWVN